MGKAAVTKRPRSLRASHKCTPVCHHTCGEMGGLTDMGKPCKQLTGEGIVGVTAGQWGRRCQYHDDLGPIPKAIHGILGALTVWQRRFVEAYCGPAHGNGTLAARMAGHPGPDASAAQASAGLVKTPQVKEAIQAWMTTFAMSAVELTHRIADMADVNPGPFTQVTAEGKIEWHVTQEAWAAYKHWVKGVEWDVVTGRYKLILHDARSAQRDLAKILKLYSDAPQLTLNVYATMSDAELAEELEEERRKLVVAQQMLGAVAVLSEN